MESVAPDNRPHQAGVEAADLSALRVRHPGSQAGAKAVNGSVFFLRHPGSSQIPGHIPCVVAAAGSAAVRAKNITQEAQDLAMPAHRSVHKPAKDVVESVNVPVDIFYEDEGQGGEEEPEVVFITSLAQREGSISFLFGCSLID